MSVENRAKKTTVAILNEVFGGYGETDFAVRLWDGTIWPAYSAASPASTLTLNHAGALRQMLLSGSAHGFESGRLNIYQALLAKPGSEGESGLPLTRADLYDDRA
jgi:hypothetical protein